MPAEPWPLAVVGGGATAAWLLLLLRHEIGRLPPTIVLDPVPRLGLGLAYGTRRDEHRLNVTADKMDMHPLPGVISFVDWLAVQTGEGPSDHVSRHLYARYLDQLIADHLRGEPIVHRHRRAVAIRRQDGAFTISLDDGDRIAARRVVLAIGNPRSRPLGASPHARIVEEPFGPWPDLAEPRDVLVAGAGLTAIDAILEADHRWPGVRFTVVAPHAFFPPADRTVEPSPFDLPRPCPSPSELWRWAKRQRSASTQLASWFAPVDALRPHTTTIWQAWTARERSVFLRHAARYWLHLRHRAAPQAAERMAELEADGRLAFVRGRAVLDGRPENLIDVTIGERRLTFDLAINAIGPDLNPRGEPLLATLADDGLVSPDPLGLGIRADLDGTVLDAQGTRVERLQALGVWTRGARWEVVAIPHIREAIRAALAADHWRTISVAAALASDTSGSNRMNTL
jgi:uncharacterized NAD(P)/FAD-binding protein YdhS